MAEVYRVVIAVHAIFSNLEKTGLFQRSGRPKSPVTKNSKTKMVRRDFKIRSRGAVAVPRFFISLTVWFRSLVAFGVTSAEGVPAATRMAICLLQSLVPIA